MHEPLDEETKLQWLRLLRTENVGPVTFAQLLKRFGSAEAALENLPQLSRSTGRKTPLSIPPLHKIMMEYEGIRKIGAKLVGYTESSYPELLRQVRDAPPLISVLGDLSLLHRPLFAIVGARNGSAAGKRLTDSFASNLGQAGFVVVSGMARGIDAQAHQSSLKTGTVAVLAGGIDQIYPPENQQLYEAIAKAGVILSETPLGQAPHAALFPRRNRLISGMSRGVLVVEAAANSGSLLTASFAADQGRDVFAIPGNPLDPRARGTNQLIRDGAILVQRPEEIIEFYSGKRVGASEVRDSLGVEGEEFSEAKKVDGSFEENSDALERCRQQLLEVLSPTPIEVDVLASQMQVSSALVRAALVEIEIAGYLGRHSGDRVCLLPFMSQG